MSDQLTQQQIEDIQNALVGCRKIEAIKIYRKATGQGLKEAKDFIEALIPKLIEQDPEKFKSLASQKTSGCAGAVLWELACWRHCFGLSSRLLEQSGAMPTLVVGM